MSDTFKQLCERRMIEGADGRYWRDVKDPLVWIDEATPEAADLYNYTEMFEDCFAQMLKGKYDKVWQFDLNRIRQQAALIKECAEQAFYKLEMLREIVERVKGDIEK